MLQKIQPTHGFHLKYFSLIAIVFQSVLQAFRQIIFLLPVSFGEIRFIVGSDFDCADTTGG